MKRLLPILMIFASYPSQAKREQTSWISSTKGYKNSINLSDDIFRLFPPKESQNKF